MSWKEVIQAKRIREISSENRRWEQDHTRLLRRFDAIVQVADSTIKGLGDTDEAIGLSEDDIEQRMMEIIEIATGKKWLRWVGKIY